MVHTAGRERGVCSLHEGCAGHLHPKGDFVENHRFGFIGMIIPGFNRSIPVMAGANGRGGIMRSGRTAENEYEKQQTPKPEKSGG
jgi:hypothetical protein